MDTPNEFLVHVVLKSSCITNIVLQSLGFDPIMNIDSATMNKGAFNLDNNVSALNMTLICAK